MNIKQELIKVANSLKIAGEDYQYYKFHSSGDLHRNVVLMSLWKEYGLKSTDVEVYKDGIKANNKKANDILRKLFN